MKIPTHYLEAFHSLVKTKSFTISSQKLFITQSALSQRIKNLENLLEQTLIIRSKHKFELTNQGKVLLEYCLNLDQLNTDFENKLNFTNNNMPSGLINIYSFSTFTKSRLLPMLTPHLLKNSDIKINIQNAEIKDLKNILKDNKADIIFTLKPFNLSEYDEKIILQEENVLIESMKAKNLNIYIDHDEEDQTTLNFLSLNNISTQKVDRIYLDEIYSIITAVELGLGKAVVPKHLIEHNNKIRILKNYKLLMENIYIVRKKLNYYSNVHKFIWNLF